MKIVLVALGALALTAGSAGAQVIVHGPKTATDAIVAAEKAYSARFSEVGVARGMREFLDKDGLAFEGGDPVRGPEAAFKSFGGDTDKAKLSWTVAEVFASKGGDMGASWGRYVLDTGQPKPATGRYVTVWRKTADGKWKAIMDIGTPDPH